MRLLYLNKKSCSYSCQEMRVTSRICGLNTPQSSSTAPYGRGQPPPSTSVGTPIRLVPSAAAFRKPGLQPGTTPIQNPAAPVPIAGASRQSPSARGVISQVTDLLCGW
ncbi:hypothetical protein EDD17DRAFT_655218 [Pisolithus thermaeus]|nr:hypothetical protein EDD17DRAFT_655218 [Pisolithus thermaeus]